MSRPPPHPGRGDLHLHTCYSDGTDTPEELALRAANAGLGVIALTDHDSVEGCPRAAAACAKHNLRFIPGAELTVDHDGAELHVLAYNVDLDHPEFLHLTRNAQQAREHRIHEIASRLQELGIEVSAEAIFRVANCRSPGRPHVGRALVEAKVCASVDEAFERFLKRDRPAWVPKPKPPAANAIGTVHQAGGIAVLAHPGLYAGDRHLSDLVSAGLDGLECFHSRHSQHASLRFLDLARNHGLLVTGGSDCHGFGKSKPLIGTVDYPREFLERFLARLGSIHSPVIN